MNTFKKLFVFLSLLIVNNGVLAKFSNQNLSNYYFAGEFGFQTPFDASTGKYANYYYVINSIPDLDLPSNTPMRLANLLGDRVSQLKIINGTKIILKPELDAAGKTKEQNASIYKTIPYVVVEGENDFINIYIYNVTNIIGTKLVFNISAFEDFMSKTPWYGSTMQGVAIDKAAWHIGFEFFTAETDFTGLGLAGEKPTLFTDQQGIYPFFIDLDYTKNPRSMLPPGLFAWYNNVQSPFKEQEPYFPAQYFIALGNIYHFDKSKWNPKVFFQNNIVYTRGMSNDDVDHVQKILTDAGISLTSN